MKPIQRAERSIKSLLNTGHEFLTCHGKDEEVGLETICYLASRFAQEMLEKVRQETTDSFSRLTSLLPVMSSFRNSLEC